MLAFADFLAAITAAASLAIGSGDLRLAVWSALVAPLWLVIAKVTGLYDRDQRTLRHLTVDEFPRIVTWALAAVAADALVLAVLPASGLTGAQGVRLGVVAAFTAILFRAVARTVWRHITPAERAVIIGDGALAHAARRKLELFPDIHVEVVQTIPEVSFDQLGAATRALQGLDRVIVATSQLDERIVAALVATCRAERIKLSVVPPLRGVFGTAVQLNHVADLPVVEYNTWDVSRSTMFLKRTFDVTVSALALVIVLPVMALIGAAVWIDNGRPLVFRQLRAGQGARPFNILKFRTMVPDAEQRLAEILPFELLEEPMYKIRADPRVTSLGRILRRTSLDELPQLLNVLRGDMSLVGPRPEQMDLVERYDDAHLFRLAVKPGLTGPMQIYGRGDLTFEERLAVERDYIENISLGRDLRILALTFASVFHGRGAF